MRTALRPVAALAAILAAALPTAGVGAAGPAAVDEGDGVFTVEQAEPAGGTAVHYVVRLTWSNDGHPVRDATMTAAPLGADGAPATPVPLTPVDQEGRYEATVEFPAAGNWTVRFTSVTPPGTLEQPQVVSGATTSTTGAPTNTTGAPADDDSEAAGATDTAESDDGGTPWAPIAIGTAAVVAVGAGVLAVRRRRPA